MDPSGEEYNTRVAEIAVGLEITGIPIYDARSYARQEMAANPNEKNIDVFWEYAMAFFNLSFG